MQYILQYIDDSTITILIYLAFMYLVTWYATHGFFLSSWQNSYGSFYCRLTSDLCLHVYLTCRFSLDGMRSFIFLKISCDSFSMNDKSLYLGASRILLDNDASSLSFHNTDLSNFCASLADSWFSPIFRSCSRKSVYVARLDHSRSFLDYERDNCFTHGVLLGQKNVQTENAFFSRQLVTNPTMYTQKVCTRLSRAHRSPPRLPSLSNGRTTAQTLSPFNPHLPPSTSRRAHPASHSFSSWSLHIVLCVLCLRTRKKIVVSKINDDNELFSLAN